MKVTVVVLVYDRYDNLRHWLDCWKKCNKGNSELVVIHNTDDFAEGSFREICSRYNIKLIERKNVGYDIGAFQDVCRNRLEGFPEWERVLWFTDDVFPMDLNFVRKFSDRMHPSIGVVCMQVSMAFKQHIRTSAFMIDKEVAVRLKFHVDPVVTKLHGHEFEHRHPTLTFYQQIARMHLRVIQVAPNEISPVWDSGYPKRLHRWPQHEALFGRYIVEPRKMTDLPKHNEPVHSVTFVCTIFNAYPQIVSSLLMQTNPNWKLWLIHNGPGNVSDVPDDPRITVFYTAENSGFWGHPNRAEFLQRVDTEYVVITSHDNYHVPSYVEYLMGAFSDGTIGTYCSDMVHNYFGWRSVPCSLRFGHIDCACMMLKTKQAQEVGWNDITSQAADWTFFNELVVKYGGDKFVKVTGCLLVHN